MPALMHGPDQYGGDPAAQRPLLETLAAVRESGPNLPLVRASGSLSSTAADEGTLAESIALTAMPPGRPGPAQRQHGFSTLSARYPDSALLPRSPGKVRQAQPGLPGSVVVGSRCAGHGRPCRGRWANGSGDGRSRPHLASPHWAYRAALRWRKRARLGLAGAAMRTGWSVIVRTDWLAQGGAAQVV